MHQTVEKWKWLIDVTARTLVVFPTIENLQKAAELSVVSHEYMFAAEHQSRAAAAEPVLLDMARILYLLRTITVTAPVTDSRTPSGVNRNMVRDGTVMVNV